VSRSIRVSEPVYRRIVAWRHYLERTQTPPHGWKWSLSQTVSWVLNNAQGLTPPKEDMSWADARAEEENRRAARRMHEAARTRPTEMEDS
jgi:hypothetical protein